MKVNPKRISLILSVIVSSTLTWAVAHLWLNNSARFSDFLVMLWPALTFIFAGAVTAVAFLLMDQWIDCVAATLASWAVFVFFFAPNIWYISVLPVFGAFWVIARHHIRADLTDRRTIRPSAILGQGMKSILLGSFLMVSLGFYLLPTPITITSISRDIQRQAQAISGNPLVAPQVDQLVRSWLGPVKQFIPPILAFALFLTLWSINVLFRGPAIWLGDFIFRLLRRIGFVRIHEKSMTAEVLEL